MIATSKAGVSVNKKLAEELHKPVIKKKYARFKDNIRAANLAEMVSLSSKNKNINIYCVSQMFSRNMHELNL